MSKIVIVPAAQPQGVPYDRSHKAAYAAPNPNWTVVRAPRNDAATESAPLAGKPISAAQKAMRAAYEGRRADLRCAKMVGLLVRGK